MCCWVMFHVWWEKIHGLCMMGRPHIPAHPVHWRTHCMMPTPTWFKCSWLFCGYMKNIYCDSIQQVYGTELKTAVTVPKDASNMFDLPSAASDVTEDILCTWYETVYCGCAQEAVKTTQHLKFRKGNQKWLRMEAFPHSSSHNIACLYFVVATLTVILDLWLLNNPHLHTWTC
jgi:hypothetical protein